MDVPDSELLKSLISHKMVQQMSLILSRRPSVYIFFWTAFVSKNLMTCLSHGLKARPHVSLSGSTKIELPLDISEEQRHFLSSLTTVLVANSAWKSVLEWPVQGVAFRRTSKGSVRGDQMNPFIFSCKKHSEALRTSACSGPGGFLAQYPGSWAHPLIQSCKGLKFGLLFPESGDKAAIKHH